MTETPTDSDQVHPTSGSRTPAPRRRRVLRIMAISLCALILLALVGGPQRSTSWDGTTRSSGSRV